MLKATGIVRKVDELGRVVLPIELRRTLGVSEKDSLEIFVNGQDIVLRKYEPGCSLCSVVRPLTSLYPGKQVCGPCVEMVVKSRNKLIAAISR